MISTAGGFGEETPKHDNVPNMKLVMNPEGKWKILDIIISVIRYVTILSTVVFSPVAGKVHLWDDLPADQRPDIGQAMASTFSSLPHNLPEERDPVAESLQAGVGKGEPVSFYRPRTFVSAYRQVFDQNRGVFGSRAALKSPPESPLLAHKHSVQSAQHTPPVTAVTNNNSNEEKCRKAVSKSDKKTKDPKSPVAPARQVTLATEPVQRQQGGLKRHKSFTEDKTSGVDQRQPKYFAEPGPSPASIKPSDVLRTPYLLPTVHNNKSNNNNNINSNISKSNSRINVIDSSSQGAAFNNFPQITSTSMVAKTKALFEGKEGKDKTEGFLPLGKSRTFSCFPTAVEEGAGGLGAGAKRECPLTPSVPQRKSSRVATSRYKSMNSSINSCGIEAERVASPFQDHSRIPMRNFF